jgi:DNA-binding MarR family transcriptional regulator
VRGHGHPNGPTIRDIAGYLLLRHNSVVGLVDRAEAAGLVRRERDAGDLRVVRVLLTPSGEQQLERLTAKHLDELDRIRRSLKAAREALERYEAAHPGPAQGGA